MAPRCVNCNGSLTPLPPSNDGWSCDAYKNREKFPQGCARGCTGFNQSSGWGRYRCASCDFDLCDGCHDRELEREQRPGPGRGLSGLFSRLSVKSRRQSSGAAASGASHSEATAVQDEARMLELQIRGEEENSKQLLSGVAIHRRVCDGCGTRPVAGPCYSCNSCDDYDLCSSCYEMRGQVHPHHTFSSATPSLSGPDQSAAMECQARKGLHAESLEALRERQRRQLHTPDVVGGPSSWAEVVAGIDALGDGDDGELVQDVMAQLDRVLFVPRSGSRASVEDIMSAGLWKNAPLPLSDIQSPYLRLPTRISAPEIHYKCLAALSPWGEPAGRGLRCLDIGCGTGYLSTAMSLLAGKNGIVFGLEMVEGSDGVVDANRTSHLVGAARTCIDWALKQEDLAGTGGVSVVRVLGDNIFNPILCSRWAGSFDRVVGGACVPAEAQLHQLLSLLAPGGILVVPFGNELKRYTRKIGEDSSFTAQTLAQVRFTELCTFAPSANDREEITREATERVKHRAFVSELASSLQQNMDDSLLFAWNSIRRGNFVPAPLRLQAYESGPFVVDSLDTRLSAGSMQAISLHSLGIRAGDAVLDIGCGTGFLAALAGAVVGPKAGRVVGIDISDKAIRFARQSFRLLCETTPIPLGAVEFLTANCFSPTLLQNLQAANLPIMFDRIVCGATIPREHLPKITQLLSMKYGSTLACPIDDKFRVYRRLASGGLSQTDICGVRFTELVVPAELGGPSSVGTAVANPSAPPAHMLPGGRTIPRDSAPISSSSSGGIDAFQWRKEATSSASESGGTIWSVAVSGDYLACGTAGCRVVLYSTRDLSKAICVFTEPKQTVYSCAMRGDWIVAADGSGVIFVWSLRQALAAAQSSGDVSGALLRHLYGHTNDVNAMHFASDTHLVTGSTDDTMKVWNVAALLQTRDPANDKLDESEQQIRLHSGTLWDVSPLDDGTVFSGSTDQTIVRCNWRTGHKVGSTMTGTPKWVICVSATPEFVVSGDEMKNVRIWSTTTHNLLHSIDVADFENRKLEDIWSIKATQSLFFAGGSDGVIRTYSYDGKLLSNLEVGDDTDAVHSIVTLPNGRIVAAAGGHLVLLAGPTLETSTDHHGHNSTVTTHDPAPAPSARFQLIRGQVPSGGLRVRRHPSLSSQQVGSVEWGAFPNDIIAISKVEGTWGKLDPSLYQILRPQKAFQEHNPHQEGWVAISLSGKTLLRQVEDARPVAAPSVSAELSRQVPSARVDDAERLRQEAEREELARRQEAEREELARMRAELAEMKASQERDLQAQRKAFEAQQAAQAEALQAQQDALRRLEREQQEAKEAEQRRLLAEAESRAQKEQERLRSQLEASGAASPNPDRSQTGDVVEMLAREVTFMSALCRDPKHYRVVRKLGEGSSGIVCEVSCAHPRHPNASRTYALKTCFNLDTTTTKVADAFENEFRELATLPPSPYVTRFFCEFIAEPPDDVLEHFPALPRSRAVIKTRTGGQRKRKSQFFVVEKLSSSLEDYLETIEGVLDLHLFLTMVRDIARGIQHLSQNNVVHLDQKLDNVLVDLDNGNSLQRCVLSDFGQAIHIDDSWSKTPTATANGGLWGNEAHICPELLNSLEKSLHGSGDTKFDYSGQPAFELGVLAFEIALGDHALPDYPLDYKDHGNGLVSYDVDQIESLDNLIHESGYPAPLCEMITSLVAFEPSSRPSVDDALELIERLLTETSGTRSPPPSIDPAGQESGDAKLCQICMEAPHDTAFTPCGHLACCHDCASMVQEQQGNCPFCRSTVTGVLRIFTP